MLPGSAVPRALAYWSNYQFIIGVGDQAGSTAAQERRLNVYHASLNATYYATVQKSNSYTDMNGAETDGIVMYVPAWVSGYINRVNVSSNTLPDIAPTPWISVPCPGSGEGPFSTNLLSRPPLR